MLLLHVTVHFHIDRFGGFDILHRFYYGLVILNTSQWLSLLDLGAVSEILYQRTSSEYNASLPDVVHYTTAAGVFGMICDASLLLLNSIATSPHHHNLHEDYTAMN